MKIIFCKILTIWKALNSNSFKASLELHKNYKIDLVDRGYGCQMNWVWFKGLRSWSWVGREGARLWGLTVYRVETGGGWAKVYKSNRHGWVSAGCGE